MFMLLQSSTELTPEDCWNTDNLPEDGQLDEVNLGTISSGGGGLSGLEGTGAQAPNGPNSTGYGGYIGSSIYHGGGYSGNTSISPGGVDLGAATILMNPIGSNTLDQNTQNHINKLNELTGHSKIKTKINELQGKLNYPEEFGYQFTENGDDYSIIPGVPDASSGAIGFPAAQQGTVLEAHTHHAYLDPVFSAEDIFNEAKLFNSTNNQDATVILITTLTKLYALKINDATLANNFFNQYNSDQGLENLQKDYNTIVIKNAQQYCNGTCSDAQYEIYLNHYLNQFLQLLDTGLALYTGYENADGTIVWNP